MAELRVLIVADDPLVRAGLGALLADRPGWVVAGQTASIPSDALPAAVDAYRPDVVLWDLGWNPRPALERLAGLRSQVPVAVLLPESGIGRAGEGAGQAAVADAAAALTAGAHVLLLRSTGGARLAAALAAAAHGLVVIDPVLAPDLLAHSLTGRGEWSAADDQVPIDLTPREREVLRLLADGLSNKAIARSLDISEHTVKFHVNAILGKLGVQSRTEAVVRATRLGLILL